MNENNSRNSDMILNEVYFWTSTIVAWKHLLKHDKYKETILASLKNLAERKLIAVYGFVIMPNHIHVLWEMLSMNNKEMPDSSFTKFTAHEFKKDLKGNHPLVLDIFKSDKADRDYQFWQRDALAVMVTNMHMFEQKLDYIHLNPLSERWNLAKRPEDYHWSSAGFYETGVDGFGFLTHYKERF